MIIPTITTTNGWRIDCVVKVLRMEVPVVVVVRFRTGHDVVAISIMFIGGAVILVVVFVVVATTVVVRTFGRHAKLYYSVPVCS